MAARVLDLTRDYTLRVAAHEIVEEQALERFKGLTCDEALTEVYKAFEDDEHVQWRPVFLTFAPEDLPGWRASR